MGLGRATGDAWIDPSSSGSLGCWGGYQHPHTEPSRRSGFKGKTIPKADVDCEERRERVSSLPSGSRKILPSANPAFKGFPPENTPSGACASPCTHMVTKVPIKNTFRV